MKIALENGRATVDADDLGPLLGIAPALVPEKMRSGEITSRFETGTQDDAGRFRLTFFHDRTRLRLTCSADGTVLSTTRVPVGR
ncbi:DUF6522 family protein [uncultured Sulfitobacter sp.]|uniref:DUF6522 family protein n=1 Tax=uncultured Sulfitobacter sp. TaxID=191468 RepID=UPI0026377843|nr:DUF6522 family protein [uncultured Sulfitobacter sp.]